MLRHAPQGMLSAGILHLLLLRLRHVPSQPVLVPQAVPTRAAVAHDRGPAQDSEDSENSNQDNVDMKPPPMMMILGMEDDDWQFTG